MAVLLKNEFFAFRRLLEISRLSFAVRYYAQTAVSQEESDAVRYPSIKPRYPPGQWGEMRESSAWNLHGKAEQLLEVPRIKERLEQMAGDKPKLTWIVEAMDIRPKNIEYRQMLTKTHIAKGLPEAYNTNLLSEADALYNRFRSETEELINFELEYHYKIRLQENLHGAIFVDKEKYITQRMLSAVLSSLSTRLAESRNYFLQSMIDELVRVETFWCVGGFREEGNHAKGKWGHIVTLDRKNYGMLLCSYRHKADWQIRTENPLPEFLHKDDALCTSGNVPHLSYGPVNAGFKYTMDRPMTVSGHWVGDPCEYCPLSVHVMPTSSCKQLKELGEQFVRDAQFAFGMTAAFGSCASQAYNQGFTWLHDMTYPLTTQCLVTDGRHIQLFAYQLNTLRLWVDDGGPRGNPHRNIVWASEAIPLFEGDSRRPNADAFKLLISALLLQPAVRSGVDMRPFLPHEQAPVKQTAYMNRMGEDPFPYEKIGRFQYPRNAVYF